MNQIVITADGSHTIYVPELNEHFHSVHGAVQESQHIFINGGFDFCKANPVRIFEVGFGTGLNALLTALKSQKDRRRVLYTTIEKYPLDMSMMHNLNHSNSAGSYDTGIAGRIYSAPWDEITEINGCFSIQKLKADLVTDNFTGTFDLIYFDAFGPDKQPEMWSISIFEKIASLTISGGILVTYSAKGQVKRNLKATGFEVTLLAGPPGKRQIIRAIKI